MENLDEFMRQKMESDAPAERFPFREEYWEQAQAMLEADEARRRRKRRWLIWWFFGGLLLGAGLWYGKRHWASPQPTAQQAPPVVQSPVGQDNATAKPLVPPSSANTNAAAAPTPEALRDTDAQDKIQNTENQGIVRASTKVGPNSAPNAPASQPAAPTPTPSTSRPPSSIPQSPVQPTENAITPSTLHLTPSTFHLPPSTLHLPPSTPNPQFSILNSPFSINLLSLPFPPANLQRPPLALPAVPARERQPAAPRRSKTPRFALVATGAIWAGNADKNIRTGGSAAATYCLPLTPKWALRTGIAWRYLSLVPGIRPVESADSNYAATQYRYGFGQNETRWTRDILGLHYLNASVALQREKGPFAYFGGAEVGRLLLAQTRLRQSLRDPFGNTQTLLDRLEPGALNLYPQWYLGGQVGASWHFLPRWQLLAQLNYRLSKLLLPDKVDNAPQQGRWGLDFGLQYKIN